MISRVNDLNHVTARLVGVLNSPLDSKNTIRLAKMRLSIQTCQKQLSSIEMLERILPLPISNTFDVGDSGAAALQIGLYGEAPPGKGYLF